MKRIIALVILLAGIILASPVERNLTEKVAQNWYGHFFGESKITDHFDLGNENTALIAYTFENGGFVIVANDDASIPVVGFSKDSKFNSNLGIPSIKEWFENYYNQIDDIKELKLDNSETKGIWSKVASNDFSFIDNKAKSVEPLLTTKWDQAPIYNNYCPIIDGSHAVVGCVATAMAQIMKYYNYPDFGKGAKTYYSSSFGDYLTAEFGNTNYQWDLMPDQIYSTSADEEIHEVAQISYHVGVAVSMDYGVYGSAAQPIDLLVAMREYFKYDESITQKYKSQYTSQNWNDLLQNELNNARPVYYVGEGEEAGHAFVMDGYQPTNHYHFNWGWSGSNDGYFYLDNLNPGAGGAGGGSGHFTLNQRAIYNIIPKPVNLYVNDYTSEYLLEENSVSFNLEDIFQSANGDLILYSIENVDNDNIVSCTITGDELTVSRIGDGYATIRVRANTEDDTCFKILNFFCREKLSFAGNGYMVELADNDYVEYTGEAHHEIDKVTLHGQFYFNDENIEGLFSMSNSTTSGIYVNLTNGGILKFMVETEDNQKRKIYSESAILPGIWYNLDFIYDGKDQYIYIDGVLDNHKVYDTSSNIKTLSNPFRAGIVAGTCMNGFIDNIYVYDYNLSGENIREIMKGNIVDDFIIGINFDSGDALVLNNLADNENVYMMNMNLENYQSSEAPFIYYLENGEAVGVLKGEENSVFEIVNNTSHGQLSLNGNGEFVYNYSGSGIVDSFTFKAESNGVSSAVYGVEIRGELTGVNENTIPQSSSLVSAYPNPFNPETNINFYVNSNNNVELSVFNISGELVETICSKQFNLGFNQVKFDACKLGSGVYFCRMKCGNELSSIKLMLVK
ncbi:MAG: C10 family peptidase [Candidatus Delongbacteria bacterium]|nr:C10 family peptidase [Candidatus Delongbacteria bacterium]MBN2833657.1 C10 family peptidase [Candidatus Delongbacteria bacterium]